MRVTATAAIAAFALLLSVAFGVPLILAGGDAAAAPPCTPGIANSGPVNLNTILLTIRQIESGGRYTATNPTSSASGAYQFLDTTWNHYNGYQRAADAPPAVQDQYAANSVQAILNAHSNTLAAVPVAWYLGHVPPPASPEWDTTPPGNTITPRQYQTRWLNAYNANLTGSTQTGPAGRECPTTGPDGPAAGGWAFPLPRNATTLTALGRPHHDYPAIDIPVPDHTPVYAVRSGTVTSTTTTPDPCGNGITIRDTQNFTWIYCHATTTQVTPGATVTAGQQIMLSGHTGDATGPHLHLGIRDPNHTNRCPQTELQTIWTTGAGTDPAGLPTTGCHT